MNRAERCALSMHLLVCRVCRKYKRQLKLMREVLTSLKEPDPYYETAPSMIDKKQSAEMRERISKKIHKNLDSK